MVVAREKRVAWVYKNIIIMEFTYNTNIKKVFLYIEIIVE